MEKNMILTSMNEKLLLVRWKEKNVVTSKNWAFYAVSALAHFMYPIKSLSVLVFRT